MKIIIVPEFAIPYDYRMICGTCRHRGNVSTAWDPGANDNVRITGVECNYNSTRISVKYEDKCEHYSPVNDILKRVMLNKRLI